jgi:hypothetical protein
MKHLSTPPKSRRTKPHYEHVTDKKKLSLLEAFAKLGHTIGEWQYAFSTGFTKGAYDARQRNAHPRGR